MPARRAARARRRRDQEQRPARARRACCAPAPDASVWRAWSWAARSRAGASGPRARLRPRSWSLVASEVVVLGAEICSSTRRSLVGSLAASVVAVVGRGRVGGGDLGARRARRGPRASRRTSSSAIPARARFAAAVASDEVCRQLVLVALARAVEARDAERGDRGERERQRDERQAKRAGDGKTLHRMDVGAAGTPGVIVPAPRESRQVEVWFWWACRPECAGSMRSMSLARAWRRQLLGASTAALIVPSAMVAALVTLALSGAFSQVGVLGQLFVGPSLPGAGPGPVRVQVRSGRGGAVSRGVAAGDSGFGFGFAAPGGVVHQAPASHPVLTASRGTGVAGGAIGGAGGTVVTVGGGGSGGGRPAGPAEVVRWRTRWWVAGGLLARFGLGFSSACPSASASAQPGGHGGDRRHVGDPAGSGAGRAGGDTDDSGRRLGRGQPDPADRAAMRSIAGLCGALGRVAVGRAGVRLPAGAARRPRPPRRRAAAR